MHNKHTCSIVTLMVSNGWIDCRMIFAYCTCALSSQLGCLLIHSSPQW